MYFSGFQEAMVVKNRQKAFPFCMTQGHWNTTSEKVGTETWSVRVNTSPLLIVCQYIHVDPNRYLHLNFAFSFFFFSPPKLYLDHLKYCNGRRIALNKVVSMYINHFCKGYKSSYHCCCWILSCVAYLYDHLFNWSCAQWQQSTLLHQCKYFQIWPGQDILCIYTWGHKRSWMFMCTVRI